jgi:CRISPR-associated endonuclease Csn1
MNDKQKIADLNLAFDVGHSSIGWAVLQTADGGTRSVASVPARENGGAGVPPANDPTILGCGAVIFRADDCLASKRRGYRRQRRHIRSTRQRIARMKLLLQHLGVLSDGELNSVTTSSPWKLAAQVLATNGQLTLTWPQLWDVLRWYAHNRGYDGNRRWSAAEIDEQEAKEDSEKEENAKNLLQKHGVKTMAETFCKELGVDPVGKKASSQVRFKGLNAAFPREVVETEVRRILRAHFGKLKSVDANFERVLCGRDNRDKDAWQAIPCPAIKLPKRYEGGLLFGQLVPRFDNRIISKCPVTGEKVPSRNCREFLNFRWAMQLANVRVAKNGERELRPLTAVERKKLDEKMRAAGAMTATEFTKAVIEATGATRSNLETMLMHPDAKEALLLDPVQKELTKGNWASLFLKLPERIQKRARGQLRRGRLVTLGKLYEQAKTLGESVAAFDAEIQRILDAANTQKGKKAAQLSRDSILGESASVKKLSGRAAYSRPILQKAYEEVMAGKHPKEEGGCLFVSEKMREAQLQREIDEQTNNHLVRHRLRLLERLQRDIIKEYAGGDRSRIGRITIEVNRDLREMSGKTAKEKAQDMGLRLSDHRRVAEKLEKALKGQTFNGKPIVIGASLIRKARIAEDLDWTCPYTGQKYEPIDLVTRRVDKDHIVPRSQRASDSLDSLVITFSAINKWKGKRTALKFIEDEQGKPIPDMPNLSILSLKRYSELVNGLETFKGHDDDKKRKERRKKLLMVRDYEEGEFLRRCSNALSSARRNSPSSRPCLARSRVLCVKV